MSFIKSTLNKLILNNLTLNKTAIAKGIFAGFIATLALTVLMMMKKTMGVMPTLDPVHMLSDMAAAKMGIAPHVFIGWVMHFVIGALAWGGAFAVFNKVLPSNNQVNKGIVLGIIAWFMMIGPMPMSGAGLFGLSLGIMAPVITLVLHLVYGAVLGVVFTKIAQKNTVELPATICKATA
jgi:hypothetical protein